MVASESTKRRSGVLGSPIRHSLSPALHNAAYAALSLTGWRYDAFECDKRGLPGFVERLGPEWAGLSLTMPLKRVAMTVADEVSPLASAVGAANTLVLGQPGAARRAENTDVAGILAALRETGIDRVNAAVILGAGGTAQAALAALRELGETTPMVLVRDPSRTADLRTAAERLDVQPMISSGLLDGALPGALFEADIVISTLPPGAADTLSHQRWKAHPVVLDVVYTPWPTPLAASARAAGCRTVSGLAVLLHQAVAQVELMTGRRPPVAQMRAALDAAYRSRSST
ncbi:MAG: shikimate dehydrogenase [Pseudonocardiaceae bacterium]